jgi:hypothetical protein
MDLATLLRDAGDKFLAAHRAEYEERVAKDAEFRSMWRPWDPDPPADERAARQACRQVVASASLLSHSFPGLSSPQVRGHASPHHGLVH